MKTNEKTKTSRSSVEDFIHFRLMLGTKLVKPIWAGGAIWLTVGSAALIHLSIVEGGALGAWGVVSSVFLAVFGNMLWRIVCEAFLAFFSMFSSVQESLHSIDRAIKTESLLRSDN